LIHGSLLKFSRIKRKSQNINLKILTSTLMLINELLHQQNTSGPRFSTL